MAEKVELRQRRGRTKERYWTIERKANTLYTEWGMIVEGKKSVHGTTADTIHGKGKEGTAAFVNDVDNAIFNMDREVRKKLEEGYELPSSTGSSSKDEICHDQPLPKNLAFCKPSKKPNKKAMGRHDIIGTVKFNGETVIAQKMQNGTVKVYSRRMIDITDWFPQLANFMESADVPPRTIMMFEGHMGRGATRKDALKAASIFRSKAPLALEKQEESGWMKFYLFRVPIWDGEHLEKNYPASSQLDWIANNVGRLMSKKAYLWEGQKVLVPLQMMRNLTVDSALQYARENKLEGLVGYLPEETLGDQAWSFHGKPDRPTHFFKLKLDEEDDFVVLFNPDLKLGTWGTGKNQKRVGTLSMYQYNRAGGELIYCGEVGTGMTDEQRDQIAAQLRSSEGARWEGVAEIHFETRFFVSEGDDSNAIQLPRVHRFREDKVAEECICESLIEALPT